MEASGWLQFVPFILVIGIFYFIILLPMQRKQKKVQEFQQALKVGDRVITTGGIYGQITKAQRRGHAAPDRRQGAGSTSRGRPSAATRASPPSLKPPTSKPYV